MHHGGADLANTELVEQADRAVNRLSTCDTSYTGNSENLNLKCGQSSSSCREIKTHGMSFVRQSLQDRGISNETAEIIMSSWKSSTQKQYSVYINKWFQFCDERQSSQIQPSLNIVLQFLTKLYETCIAYKTMNTARSALSSLGIILDGFALGQHPLIKKFLLGFFKKRPPKERYSEIWDAPKVLSYLMTLPSLKTYL